VRRRKLKPEEGNQGSIDTEMYREKQSEIDRWEGKRAVPRGVQDPESPQRGKKKQKERW